MGSICSGIEAASVAWNHFDWTFEWFSEIADFPSKVLREKFSSVMNLGDMNNIPQALVNCEISTPDLICGGTPCQAFSLAGWKKGLEDGRGNLTLKFVDIVEANDAARSKKGMSPCTIFWENVEGVLTDKTNAFGCLVSSLAGFNDIIEMKRWPNAGVLKGPKRNIAWRVLDAKYFGVPQQRRRLYVLAGGNDFLPENILFEKHLNKFQDYPSAPLAFKKNGHHFQVFRQYTDCLYSAYGTKWNGNAAAYNGSLFVVQDNRVRRLSPLECERLMGFPDNYTNIVGAKRTNRYQAIGNSWAVPVVRWIGQRLMEYDIEKPKVSIVPASNTHIMSLSKKELFYDLRNESILFDDKSEINCTVQPENCEIGSIENIVSPDAPESIYISPVGCYGIVRRSRERNITINQELETILLEASSHMPLEEIERRSKIQRRGKYSKPLILIEPTAV